MSTKVFGIKEEETAGWRKLYNEFDDLDISMCCGRSN